MTVEDDLNERRLRLLRKSTTGSLLVIGISTKASAVASGTTFGRLDIHTGGHRVGHPFGAMLNTSQR